MRCLPLSRVVVGLDVVVVVEGGVVVVVPFTVVGEVVIVVAVLSAAVVDDVVVKVADLLSQVTVNRTNSLKCIITVSKFLFMYECLFKRCLAEKIAAQNG